MRRQLKAECVCRGQQPMSESNEKRIDVDNLKNVP